MRSQIAEKESERVISSSADGKLNSVMQIIPSDCPRQFVEVVKELLSICSFKYTEFWRIQRSLMC